MFPKNLRMIYACNRCRCGTCRENCPIYGETGLESYSAKGKLNLIWAVLEGAIKQTPSFVERLYACTLCGSCKEKCPVDIDAIKIIQNYRSKLVNETIAPLEQHKKAAFKAQVYSNPYGEAKERLDWVRNVKFIDKASTIYFVGCTTAYRHPEVANATIEILRKAKVEFTLLKNEVCCGSVFLRVGLNSLARKLAEENLKAVQNINATTIITSCAGCYRTFKNDYPKLFDNIDFEVFHVTEFLSELLDKGKLKFKEKGKRLNVAYHDPCHLGRHCKVYEAPRKILENIPKTKLVEMERNKQNSFCCGAGGGVKMAFNELSLSIGKKRLEEAIGTGSNILASACPFCKHNFMEVMSRFNLRIEICDIAEIVDFRLS